MPCSTAPSPGFPQLLRMKGRRRSVINSPGNSAKEPEQFLLTGPVQALGTGNTNSGHRACPTSLAAWRPGWQGRVGRQPRRHLWAVGDLEVTAQEGGGWKPHTAGGGGRDRCHRQRGQAQRQARGQCYSPAEVLSSLQRAAHGPVPSPCHAALTGT